MRQWQRVHGCTLPTAHADTPVEDNRNLVAALDFSRIQRGGVFPEASLAPPAGAKEYPTALDPRFLSMLYPLLYVLVPAPVCLDLTGTATENNHSLHHTRHP